MGIFCYLLAQVVHGWVDEALGELFGAELLAGCVDVVNAEVWKQLLHAFLFKE